MSRDLAAKRLAAETGVPYTQALREVRQSRERCMATTHLDAPCGPYCLLAATVKAAGTVDEARGRS